LVSKTNYRPIIGISIVSLILCGIFSPFLITGISQVILPAQANGSIVNLNGQPVGSVLISQEFALPGFFHGRNESNPHTASASGVDPDIPLQDAVSQVPRISEAMNITQDEITNVVNRHVEGTYWIFGSPYVNVLQLNVDLINSFPDQYKPVLAAH
jgi:K+-transporting ATPase ATPase C chain